MNGVCHVAALTVQRSSPSLQPDQGLYAMYVWAGQRHQQVCAWPGDPGRLVPAAPSCTCSGEGAHPCACGSRHSDGRVSLDVHLNHELCW